MQYLHFTLYETALKRHVLSPMSKPDDILEFQIDVASWRRIPRLRARLQEAARVTIAHLPKKLQFPCTATLLLTGNAKLRQLNHDFRALNKTTNVLSFPQFDPEFLPKLSKHTGGVEIGDIALAYQYVVAEAKADNKTLLNHVTHLVIHGLLHLYGYDHMDDKEADKMEKLEIKILAALGLPDPYAPDVEVHATRNGKKHRQ